jgi:hypothetical protein
LVNYKITGDRALMWSELSNGIVNKKHIEPGSVLGANNV